MEGSREKEQIKFEDALARLETIVRQLESGELDLEEALAKFEEGIGLVKICNKKLETAEKKIETLLRGEKGDFVLKTLEGKDEKGR